MNETVTITPLYDLLVQFSHVLYAAIPMMIIIAGVGAIIGSIHTEPWGGSWYPPATLLGLILIVLGIILAVNL